MHPSLTKAAVSAAAAIAEVQAAAEYLAAAMERIHGGEWRVAINHEGEFVTVARRRGNRPITPKPEVA